MGCSLYILAGGQSRRMATDKGSLGWENQTLLDSAVAKYQQLNVPVYVLSGNPSHENPSWTCIPDVFPGCGPVGAIDAALHHAQTEYLLFCPVDMPFISVEGLQCLLSENNTAKVCAFSVQHKPALFPLRLHQSMAKSWRLALAGGDRKLGKLLHTFQPIFVPGDALLSRHPRFFDNLNTPEEYQEALLWQKEKLK